MKSTFKKNYTCQPRCGIYVKRILIFVCLFLAFLSVEAQNKMVSGVVWDETGQPVIGASITEKGTTNGVLTNEEGKYNIKIKSGLFLRVSFIGMQTQDIEIDNRKNINIKLLPQAKSLDEVVVVGYGSTKKKDLTGSIASVDKKSINGQTVQNVSQAIQGKVAGVQITNNGSPGSNPTIRIRGMGSIAGESAPLFVVDGVIVNDISYLGPDDIQNVSILKDASSCAIYGVHASGGVILITTKSGKKNQKPVVSFDTYYGIKKISHTIPMADGAEYIQMYNEVMALQNNSKRLNPKDFTSYDNYKGILRNTQTNAQNLSITGGSNSVKYSIGLNRLQDNGIFNYDDYSRIGFRSKTDIDITKHIRAGFTVILNSTKTNPQSTWYLFQAHNALPIFSPKNEKGEWTDPTIIGGSVVSNVVADQFYHHYNYQNNWNAILNGYIDFDFFKNFKFKTSLSMNPTGMSSISYTPKYNVSSAQFNGKNTMSKANDQYSEILWENTLTYTKNFKDKHHLKVMLGTSYQDESSTHLLTSVSGFKDLPKISQSYFFLSMPRIEGQEGVAYPDNIGTRVVSMSYFGRVTYDYQNKYLLNLSLRNDVSTKFPKKNRSGYFPAVGAGWVVSQENFMENSKIDFLKIRMSWGLKGNANIPSNIYVPEVAYDNNYGAIIFGPGQNSGSGVISPTATIKTISNPNLKWETTSEFDLGADMTILKNRFDITADFYNRNVNNAIFPITGLAQSGLNTDGTWGNNASILNRGAELSLGWNDKVSDFSYGISANFTYNTNKVTQLSTLSSGGIYGQIAGFAPTFTYSTLSHPLAEFYGRQVIGVFQTQKQIDHTPHQAGAKPGDFIYKDLNQDGKIDDEDRTFLGNPNPPFYFGFNFNASYKNFDISLDLQGVAGNKIANAARMRRYGMENFDKDLVKHHWHGEGTSNKYPSALLSDTQVMSSFYVEDGSYLRIKSLQIGYTVPQKLLTKIKIKKLRFYLNGDNIYTFTKYLGFSPEIASTGPLTGVDQNAYPLASTYSIGLNLTF